MQISLLVTDKKEGKNTQDNQYLLWVVNYRQVQRLFKVQVTSAAIQNSQNIGQQLCSGLETLWVTRQELIDLMNSKYNNSNVVKFKVLNAKLIKLNQSSYRINIDYDMTNSYRNLMRRISLLGDKFPFDVEFDSSGYLRLNKYKLENNTGKVIIPQIIKRFRGGCFRNCRFTEIEINNSPDDDLQLDGVFSYMVQEKLKIHVKHPERIVSATQLFECSSLLKSIEFKNFTHSKIDNISYMFQSCKALTDIDLSESGEQLYDQLPVKEMTHTFERCTHLKSLRFLQKYFDLQTVENMDSAFEQCINLKEIDLTNVQLDSLTDAQSTFKGCQKLEKIICKPGEPVNIPKLENAVGTFQSCVSLRQFDFTKFDIPKIRNLNDLLKGCVNLQDIKFNPTIENNKRYGSDWNYKLLESAQYMLVGTAIEQLKLSSNTFNPYVNFSGLLQFCKNLKELELDFKIESDLDLEKFDSMLTWCDNIKKVKFSRTVIKNPKDLSDRVLCTGIQNMFFQQIDIKIESNSAFREYCEDGAGKGKKRSDFDRYLQASTYPVPGIYFKNCFVDMQTILDSK